MSRPPRDTQTDILYICRSILESLRAHDPYTYGHCRRVGRNSGLLAKEAGLNPFEQKVAETAGLLHDVGKVAVPVHILRKTGPLTEAEDALMRTHVEKSLSVVSHISSFSFIQAVLPGIQYHHERIDGKGYPHGLKGEEIPLIARIVTVADAYDAMTTLRPYRKEESQAYAFSELTRFSGTQFDPKLARLFIEFEPTWADFEIEITHEFIASGGKRTA